MLGSAACAGPGNLPTLGLHLAATQSRDLRNVPSAPSDRVQLVFSADLAFQWERARALRATPVEEPLATEDALAPAANDDCTVATLCAWETAAVERAVARAVTDLGTGNDS